MADDVKMEIEALRPFADAAGHIHPAHPDEATSLDGFPMSDFRRAAQAIAALEQAGEPVDASLLDRAELAWQRFFYPAADCFAGPVGDKLPSVDLEVADCLRLVLAAVGRLVVTPETDVPAPLPTLQRLCQEFDGEGEGFAIGDPVEKFTGEAIWNGVIVASYLTSKGKRRYVVEVKPQGFQMIAVPSQLRLMAE